MRYTTWRDVVDRYPSLAKNAQANADRIEDTVIAGVEGTLDGFLAAKYTVPIADSASSAPYALRDLATDMVYYKLARLSLTPAQAADLKEDIQDRITALQNGTLALVGSGGVIIATGPATVWGPHQDFPNVAGMDDFENWAVSDDEKDYYADTRD